jgi:hypothetical protein
LIKLDPEWQLVSLMDYWKAKPMQIVMAVAAWADL